MIKGSWVNEWPRVQAFWKLQLLQSHLLCHKKKEHGQYSVASNKFWSYFPTLAWVWHFFLRILSQMCWSCQWMFILCFISNLQRCKCLVSQFKLCLWWCVMQFISGQAWGREGRGLNLWDLAHVVVLQNGPFFCKVMFLFGMSFHRHTP